MEQSGREEVMGNGWEKKDRKGGGGGGVGGEWSGEEDRKGRGGETQKLRGKRVGVEYDLFILILTLVDHYEGQVDEYWV